MATRSEPVQWEMIERLPRDRQQDICRLILFSAGVRFGIHMDLVVPMMGRLWAPRVTDLFTRCPNSPKDLSLSNEQEERLADETTIALLRCCDCPAKAGGAFRYLDLWNLVQVAGAVVLRQMRTRCDSIPRSLDTVHYWNDKDVARTQLLIRWMHVLGITNPKFVTLMNEVGFAEAWEQNTSRLVEQTISRCNHQQDSLAESARRAWDGLCNDSRRVVAKACQWISKK